MPRDPWSIDEPKAKMYKRTKYKPGKEEMEGKKKMAESLMSHDSSNKRLAENLKPGRAKRKPLDTATYIAKRRKEKYGI